MRRKGRKHNLFSNQTLKPRKDWSFSNQFGSSINLNGCQPVQTFGKYPPINGQISINKAKRWEMTHLECHGEKGEIKIIPIVKEVVPESNNSRDNNRAHLTLFPNDDKRMMYRQEHTYPVIEIEGKNKRGRLTHPLRAMAHHKRSHDDNHWSSRFFPYGIPKGQNKPSLAELESQRYDIEDAYGDAEDCLQYDREWNWGDGW
jgi:hypothetical protein